MLLKAIRYKSIDEAQQVLQKAGHPAQTVFDDAGDEPQGLLSVIPQDRLPEEHFYGLLDFQKGILVEVEKIFYSGFGPPAEEFNYMGFVDENTAYVLKGYHLPIEIKNCPQGAQDIHHLEALILDFNHPIDRDHLAQKIGLHSDWDFDELFSLILIGEWSGEEIDRIIHQGIQ